jgi:hypothetical protein
MSISTTIIIVKTSILTKSSKRGNWRCQWHGSSRTSSRIASNQDRRRLQKANNMKMSLLIANIRKSTIKETHG